MTRPGLLILTLFILFSTHKVKAQDYHAIHGSSYAGSLGVHNNPASILMSPYKWDVTLFGGQLKSGSNLFTIYNYSLLPFAVCCLPFPFPPQRKPEFPNYSIIQHPTILYSFTHSLIHSFTHSLISHSSASSVPFPG